MSSNVYRPLKCVSTRRRARSWAAKAPAIEAVECIARTALSCSSLEKVHSWDSTSAPAPGPVTHSSITSDCMIVQSKIATSLQVASCDMKEAWERK